MQSNLTNRFFEVSKTTQESRIRYVAQKAESNKMLLSLSKLFVDLKILVSNLRKSQTEDLKLYSIVKFYQAQISVSNLFDESQSQQAKMAEAAIKMSLDQKVQIVLKAFRDQQITRLRKKQTAPELQPSQNAIHEESKDFQGQQLAHKEEDRVEDTERVIYELSSLLQQFNAKVLEQEHTSILLQDTAADSVANVSEANKELDLAKEYQKGSTDLFVAVFVTLTVIMWVWEYYNTVYVYVEP